MQRVLLGPSDFLTMTHTSALFLFFFRCYSLWVLFCVFVAFCFEFPTRTGNHDDALTVHPLLEAFTVRNVTAPCLTQLKAVWLCYVPQDKAMH